MTRGSSVGYSGGAQLPKACYCAIPTYRIRKGNAKKANAGRDVVGERPEILVSLELRLSGHVENSLWSGSVPGRRPLFETERGHYRGFSGGLAGVISGSTVKCRRAIQSLGEIRGKYGGNKDYHILAIYILSTIAEMQKNPFGVPTYTPQQPPLPPGPPPPQPAQPDYAAAAYYTQQAYNPQWSATQPAQPAAPRPPAEQSALYANYGYGGQQNWQQRQAQQQYQPAPPPVAQPPPPPPQATYNPYQPQAVAYQQSYVPPANQPVPHQTPYQPPIMQAPPPYQPPQQYFPQHQQQQQQNRQHNNRNQNIPQNSPPAKRPRFGPLQGGPPTQPSGSGPIGGGVGVGPGYNQNQAGRGGGPGVNQVPLGSGRGGFSGNRGGHASGNRGRGMMANRGNRGRGGGANMSGQRSNQGGSFRGGGGGGGSHRGFGNRDNRRGGSFGGHNFAHQQQQQHHGQNASFRGRAHGFNANRAARQDNAIPHGPKDSASSASFSSGKKEENRRTLTDFKIVGLEFRDLGWSWGVLPKDALSAEVKEEQNDAQTVPGSSSDSAQQGGADASAASGNSASASTAVKSEPGIPPPPSRIRIYFHTPISADDVHSLTPQSSLSLIGASDSGVRKGKRKKLDDDDGDIEDGRGPPPPPPGIDHDHESVSVAPSMDGAETLAGGDSVPPSVAETASEGDWLMAAIGGDQGESAQPQSSEHHDLHDEDADADADADADDDAMGEEYVEGESYEVHADATMGSIDPHDDGAQYEQGTADNGSGSPNTVESLLKGDIPPDDPEVSVEPQTSHHDPTHTENPSEPAADSNKNADSQVPAQEKQQRNPRPLQATDSLASTVPDTNEDVDERERSPYASTVIENADNQPSSQDTQPDANDPIPTQSLDMPSSSQHTNQSDLATPSTLTAVSGGGDSISAHAGPSKEKVPSANRLSISYAAGTRRMVIDAEVVEKLLVMRGEGRIEVHLNIVKTDNVFKGIMVEALSDTSTAYTSVDLVNPPADDSTIPPFNQVPLPLKTVLVAYLDKDRPLSEPRWVKTGDVQDWLKSMFGRMFWVAGDAADGWEKKIEVADPDPPPTIWTVLEQWATNSNVGTLTERQRFLRTHMSETDNILEILLRLVRGERATFSQNTGVLSAPSVSGPLLSALTQGSAHASQQTHVSLAVLAIFRLSVEFAKKANGDQGKGEVEERVGEIIRCLPTHLIYKSLDGIFKEWRVEKKGGGR
ncbi:hypothetical protein K474DRAFT_1679051 [Panus rudis PR-1116 ss-1]|nr:hypothetical protein K474DRAFT_1679051 [Panus rudis PR-1116 ss-1]